MLRKILDYQLALTQPGKPLAKLHTLVQAMDVFLYEAPVNTKRSPHIRDAVDLKRWMMIVVFALLPVCLMAIWNTGLQSFVYSSGDYRLMNEYLSSLGSLHDYFAFAAKDDRYLTILKEGAFIFLPIVFVSYAVGGLWEALFASIRGHEIAEGFLVTGILYPLILPPTIPLWMVAVGVSAGIVFGKEIFGGTGMNIVNPALCCRTFLFFTFPGKMSGDVWVGNHSAVVRDSLSKMNQDSHLPSMDSYSQATMLAKFNVNPEVKRIHIDAIASNNLGSEVQTYSSLQSHFSNWTASSHTDATLGQLSSEQMKQFITTPLTDGGLGLSPGYYDDAYRFASLNYGIGDINQDATWFLGNKLGSVGETSTLACLIGAFILIFFAVGSWRTMVATALGAFLTANAFSWGAQFFGAEGGAWAPAQFGFPAYKHFLLGGLAFGLVFMATDPVSSPVQKTAQWVFGLMVGMVAIVIRVINPAYPEGVMLSILMANCFAPLFDYYAVLNFRSRNRARVPRKATT